MTAVGQIPKTGAAVVRLVAFGPLKLASLVSGLR